jgi:uncharacterized protein YwgA
MNRIHVESTPWHKYALITYLSSRIGSKGSFGRTALQKIVYLLQELKRVPGGYSFRFYNYGPYSSTLAGDLDYVSYLGGVRVSYDGSRNFYKISAGDKVELLISKCNDFIERNKEAIDNTIEWFGDKQAKDLELTATIVYICKHKKQLKIKDDSDLIEKSKQLKPKFSEKEIQSSIAYLKEGGFV